MICDVYTVIAVYGHCDAMHSATSNRNIELCTMKIFSNVLRRSSLAKQIYALNQDCPSFLSFSVTFYYLNAMPLGGFYLDCVCLFGGLNVLNFTISIINRLLS